MHLALLALVSNFKKNSSAIPTKLFIGSDREMATTTPSECKDGASVFEPELLQGGKCYVLDEAHRATEEGANACPTGVEVLIPTMRLSMAVSCPRCVQYSHNRLR